MARDFRGFRPPWQGGQGGAEWAHGGQELDGSPLLQTSSYPFVPSRLPANGMVLATIRMVLPPCVHLSQVSRKCALHAVPVSLSTVRLQTTHSLPFPFPIVPAKWCSNQFSENLMPLPGGGVRFLSEAHFRCFSDVVTLKITMSDCCWHKKNKNAIDFRLLILYVGILLNSY